MARKKPRRKSRGPVCEESRESLLRSAGEPGAASLHRAREAVHQLPETQLRSVLEAAVQQLGAVEAGDMAPPARDAQASQLAKLMSPVQDLGRSLLGFLVGSSTSPNAEAEAQPPPLPAKRCNSKRDSLASNSLKRDSVASSAGRVRPLGHPAHPSSAAAQTPVILRRTNLQSQGGPQHVDVEEVEGEGARPRPPSTRARRKKVKRVKRDETGLEADASLRTEEAGPDAGPMGEEAGPDAGPMGEEASPEVFPLQQVLCGEGRHELCSPRAACSGAEGWVTARNSVCEEGAGPVGDEGAGPVGEEGAEPEYMEAEPEDEGVEPEYEAVEPEYGGVGLEYDGVGPDCEGAGPDGPDVVQAWPAGCLVAPGPEAGPCAVACPDGCLAGEILAVGNSEELHAESAVRPRSLDSGGPKVAVQGPREPCSAGARVCEEQGPPPGARAVSSQSAEGAGTGTPAAECGGEDNTPAPVPTPSPVTSAPSPAPPGHIPAPPPPPPEGFLTEGLKSPLVRRADTVQGGEASSGTLRRNTRLTREEALLGQLSGLEDTFSAFLRTQLNIQVASRERDECDTIKRKKERRKRTESECSETRPGSALQRPAQDEAGSVNIDTLAEGEVAEAGASFVVIH